MRYEPKVMTVKESLEMSDVADILERKGIEHERYDSHVEYRGERFDYLFWYGSIIQRDYGGNASEDDFQTWKTVYPLVETDLEFPHDIDPELPHKEEN